MFLIGHRGAKAEAPENTLYGFQHLRNLGINHVEFDLRLSADQELMIIHDDTLERTTDGAGNIIDFSARQLKNLNACKHFDASLPCEGVPTLDDVFSLWPKLQHAQLEVKPPRPEDHKIICEKIRACCEKYKLKDKCVVTSSDHAFLETCKSELSDFKRGLVYLDVETKPIESALKLGCAYLCIYWKFCYLELIQQAQSEGLHVSAWTVNETTIFKKLQDYGINSIISDYPTQMSALIS
jgi:glycerophosphoryl diester phosphodiesterase